MWTLGRSRYASHALAEASTAIARPLSAVKSCRRCQSNVNFRQIAKPLPRASGRISSSIQLAKRWNSAGSSQSHLFVSPAEESQIKLLESAGQKVEEYNRAAADVSGLKLVESLFR